jgi:vacuolar-type H+-ATPase subunit H
MGVTNEVNTYAQFPNLDQFSKQEREIFVSEHEFEATLNLMLTELNTLLDTNSGNVSEIENQKNQVSAALNKLSSDIESTLHELINRYNNLIADESNKVAAAEERIYSRIQSVIQSINVNIQNRTITYDTVMGYKLRILDAIYGLFGVTSPYSDERKNDERYSVKKDQFVELRDIDEGIGYRSCSVSLDPSIQQGEVIKLCSWEPIANGTNVPTFLAELIISGDLYAFKGRVSSSSKNAVGDRTVVFDADYFISQDLPFSIKAFYDRTNNKMVLALIYDSTNDNFTSIVKLDVSVNLLVGENLVFAPNCTKMANAGLITYGVTVNLENLEASDQSGEKIISQFNANNEYVGNATKALPRVQTGTTINIVLSAPTGKESEFGVPNIYSDELANYITVKVNGVYRTISLAPESDTHFYLSSGLLSIENVDGDVVIAAKAVVK